MDIAKIRKKIKEAEQKSGGQSASGGEEELAPKQEDKAAGKEVDSRQQTADSRQEEKPQPQEAVKEKSLSESTGKTAKPEEAVSGLPVPSARQTGIIELLTFQLAAEEFAFRISEVEEILTPQQITMVPKVPDYILGITSVRGKVMPVLDLKKRLLTNPSNPSLPPLNLRGGEGGVMTGSEGGLSADDSRKKVRKKILTLKGQKGRIGAMIDRINGVVRIDESDIEEPPAHLAESDLMFVEGVVLYNGRFISVIRLEDAANINLK
ncbi:MAG: hypothetical protein COZ31_04190 [Nitrospirae bacterium CG_4_10_14_3_um_filter_44_29]|nr:hypothetical protein [Nitrospirota bacterium]PIV66989.1 MAG: hypothetical protein COS10_03390 [Nitrospirae bacterium CG01_land_8_20_14_3_00_44_22]PIX89032.1 MAG: hypothetical protein COZ31_04190 [Nitrospirae bacterium CG_4_10_14_3_um_filter_44_29]